MAKLTGEQKAFIVRALACFDSPSQVVEAAKKEYGIVLTRQQCEAYDPTKKGGANLAIEWRTMFDATRKKFIEIVDDIPVASKSFRLRVLNRALIAAEERGNMAMVLQILELAAKEVGGAYTNKRQIISGAGKGQADTRSGVMVMPALLVTERRAPAQHSPLH